jgi:polyhydroxyalkanoate synthase
MSASSSPLNSASLQDELKRIEENTRTLLRVSTSRAKVGQTPKQVIWTFNKAKLYHYIPVVPAEKRHKIPLFLVFALMNKPYILDLRPGNSLSNTWSSKVMMSTCLIGAHPALRTKN